MMIESHVEINPQCLLKSIRRSIAADLLAGLWVLIPGAGSLERNIYASPVMGCIRVCITNLEGHTIVVSHDHHPEVPAFDTLDDEFAASAAIIGKELFLRGRRHLNCIGEDTVKVRSTNSAEQPYANPATFAGAW